MNTPAKGQPLSARDAYRLRQIAAQIGVAEMAQQTGLHRETFARAIGQLPLYLATRQVLVDYITARDRGA